MVLYPITYKGVWATKACVDRNVILLIQTLSVNKFLAVFTTVIQEITLLRGNIAHIDNTRSSLARCRLATQKVFFSLCYGQKMG